jgi:7-carboxy-7-deazaguanine synthase
VAFASGAWWIARSALWADIGGDADATVGVRDMGYAGNVSAALPISETFTSIQGEGMLTGVPSFFIRLSGCNLRCAWCDTPYASWKPEGSTRTVEELVLLARESGVEHAVLTGGEPMMFPGLSELSARLASPRSAGGAGMHITVETAGTIIPPEGVTCHLMSVSPKLSNSTPRNDPRDPGGQWASRHEQRRINVPVLQQLIDGFPPPSRQFKFVVTAAVERDVAEIDGLLGQLRGWRPGDILLMPEGTRLPEAEHQAAVVRMCVTRGWRYCNRLHLQLFGNVRGT